jgi:hypothetical protein
MLTRKTVLVLGAGASKPFNFPTGIELSQRIVELLGPTSGAYILQEMCGIPLEDTERFRSAFHHSGKNSVDAFLEHRPEFMKIGKAATACALIPFEQEDVIFRYYDNWLRTIYNNLNTSFEEFGQNKISFLTFNYDRIVEHFFYTSLKNTYGKSDAECFAALEQIPIIHLHGRLGALPWQKDKTRPFEPKVDPHALAVSMDELKIIHEDISDGRDADFEKAKALLKAADQILFMGFGYNKTNMDRLNIGDLEPNKAIGGAVGIGVRQRSLIRKDSSDKITLLPSNEDCLHMVQERIDWA